MPNQSASSQMSRKRRTSIKLEKTFEFIQKVTLPHFKQYRYFYLLMFCITLLLMVMLYAQKIFQIRENIAELIIMHRSLYSNSTPFKTPEAIERQKGIKRKEKMQEITKSQIQLGIKWKGIVNENIDHFSELANEELQYYQDKYNIIDYEEHAFCLVLYNNEEMQSQNILNNLKSILMQNYANYQIIYIENEYREDRDYKQKMKLVKQILMKENEVKRRRLRGKQTRYFYKQKLNKLIINEMQGNMIESILTIAEQNCKFTELAIFINKNNYLIGKEVLKLYNAIYEETKYKLAFTNYLDPLNNTPPNLAIAPNQTAHQILNKSIHTPLFAFPTKLLYYILDQDAQNYTKIIKNDLKDASLFLPIYQQVYGHVTYIPEISYQINKEDNKGETIIKLDSNLKDQKQEQKKGGN